VGDTVTEVRMWPYLVSATPTTPYRILLWPATAGFISEKEVMGLASQVEQGGVSSIFYLRIDGQPITCIARYRRLSDADVGGAPFDARGRPIVVAEGVVAPGLWHVDDATAWRLASGQITATLRSVWSQGANWFPHDSQPIVLPGTPAPEPTVIAPGPPVAVHEVQLPTAAEESDQTEVPRPPGSGRVRRAGRFRRTRVLASTSTLIVILTLILYLWLR